MNKLRYYLILTAALSLITSNAFAWTLIGGMLIENDNVYGSTVASSSENEVYGLNPGRNEIVFAVTEAFGGWAIAAALDEDSAGRTIPP